MPMDCDARAKSVKDYPVWMCVACAVDAGWETKERHIATYHQGLCEVCGVVKPVTEPRDFGYPDVEKRFGE